VATMKHRGRIRFTPCAAEASGNGMEPQLCRDRCVRRSAFAPHRCNPQQASPTAPGSRAQPDSCAAALRARCTDLQLPTIKNSNSNGKARSIAAAAITSSGCSARSTAACLNLRRTASAEDDESAVRSFQIRDGLPWRDPLAADRGGVIRASKPSAGRPILPSLHSLAKPAPSLPDSSAPASTQWRALVQQFRPARAGQPREPFRSKVNRFLDALGARAQTLRSPQAAAGRTRMAMHYAWMIAEEGLRPRCAPHPNIDVMGAYDASDTVDLAASRAAAKTWCELSCNTSRPSIRYT